MTVTVVNVMAVTVTVVNVMTVTGDRHCSKCDDHDREQSLVDVMTVTGLSLW